MDACYRSIDTVQISYLPILLPGLLLPFASAFAACDLIIAATNTDVVQDSSTGLTWSRCMLGQNGNKCENPVSTYSWVDALNKARASELGGIKNWRLPKIEELENAYGCLSQVLPGIGSATVWSASANLDYATDAWALDFSLGEAVVNARDSQLNVLLVASPEE